MAHWLRFEHHGSTGFGTVAGSRISVHTGDMFDTPRPDGQTLPLDQVKVLTPTVPGKMVALVDNFHALVAKLNHAVPPEPLYFLKGNNAFAAGGDTIRVPTSYAGKVVFEGELGIVIGRRCKAIAESGVAPYIFGYTCINDVTAIDLLSINSGVASPDRPPGFAQWTRAKSFDTFGVFGPVIATGIDPSALNVRTVLNEQERQNYPVADMIFPPARLVSLISQDMTLEAGDVIACGTSVGVGGMKPGSTVSIIIEGIGTLTNRFE